MNRVYTPVVLTVGKLVQQLVAAADAIDADVAAIHGSHCTISAAAATVHSVRCVRCGGGGGIGGQRAGLRQRRRIGRTVRAVQVLLTRLLGAAHLARKVLNRPDERFGANVACVADRSDRLVYSIRCARKDWVCSHLPA